MTQIYQSEHLGCSQIIFMGLFVLSYPNIMYSAYSTLSPLNNLSSYW